MRRTKNTYQKRGKIIRNYLINGDMKRIAKVLGLTDIYVSYVLAGKRYNEDVLIEALKIAKANRQIGLSNQRYTEL